MSTNQPLTQIADVRFLGKILGDVIRAYGGDALFQRIEAIRAGSVDRYRGISNPRGLDAGLELGFRLVGEAISDTDGITRQSEVIVHLCRSCHESNLPR